MFFEKGFPLLLRNNSLFFIVMSPSVYFGNKFVHKSLKETPFTPTKAKQAPNPALPV